tara:strand:+ start:3944 stop:4924 length:981 start_codon:yes stop_codon:yes gene_type:complete
MLAHKIVRYRNWLRFLMLFLSLIPAAQSALAQPETVITIDPITIGIKNDISMVGSASVDVDPLIMRVTVPEKGDHLPVVVLSHGNRLSRTDYDPLVRFLARNGFAVIQPDHPDASVDGLMISDGGGPDTWMIRAMQLRAIAENIDVLASHSPLLAARLDPDRMVVMGHSYGGHSAALAMGARPAISSEDLSMPQFRAAILLAPPGDFDGMTDEWRERAPYLDVDYGAMRGPMLIINGGIDDSVMTTQGPRWHDVPFTRGSTGQGICLMTVEGAGHYLGGIDSFLRPPGDASTSRRDLVFSAVRSFLDKALDLSASELSDASPIRCR